ncbi:uncharacterized protein LOC106461286 [Limulus polyphemus]|uniref:Uncharacterized protein LOC106461286 n=1 Tax=Limulus polyphemus TaxID=6850 RepID=A0ABM1SJQ7_LIMPO|nr:uncharacterized protein LOC106461286 [Limulus polyphemus]
MSGDTESDERWKSTGIVQRLNRRTVVTSSGSVYKLIGSMKKALALEEEKLTAKTNKIELKTFQGYRKSEIQHCRCRENIHDDSDENLVEIQIIFYFDQFEIVSYSLQINTLKYDATPGMLEKPLTCKFSHLEVQEKTVIQNTSKSRSIQQNKNSDIKHSQKKNKQKSSGGKNVKKKNTQKSDCKNVQKKNPAQRTLHQEQNASEKNATQVSVDKILSSEMQVTRSGRRVLPRLAWWANEHVHSSPITEDIIYHSISPNHDVSVLSTSLLKRCSGLNISQQYKGNLGYNSSLQSKSKKTYLQETKRNLRPLNQSQEAQVVEMKKINHDVLKDIDVASYNLKEEVMRSLKQYRLPKSRLKSKTSYSLSKVEIQEVNKEEESTVNYDAADDMPECESNNQFQNIFHPVLEENENEHSSSVSLKNLETVKRISCEYQTNQSKQMLSPVTEEINNAEIDEAEPALRQKEQEGCQTNNINVGKDVRVDRGNGLQKNKLSLSNVSIQLKKISNEKEHELKQTLSDSREENVESRICLLKESNNIFVCHKAGEIKEATITKPAYGENEGKQKVSKGERSKRSVNKRNITVDDNEGDVKCDDDEVSVTRRLRRRPVNKRNINVDDNEGDVKCDDDEVSVTGRLRGRPVNKRNITVDDNEGDVKCDDDEVSVTGRLRRKHANKRNVITSDDETDEGNDNSLSKPVYKKSQESKNGKVLVIGKLQRGSVKKKDVITGSTSCSGTEDLSLIRKQTARSKSQCQYSNLNIPDDSGYNSANGTSDYSSGTTINVFSKKAPPSRYQPYSSQTKSSLSSQLKKHDVCESKRQEALTLDLSYKTAVTGGKGTMKRKRQIHNLLTQANEGYEEDLFDSTPFRNKKTKFSDTIFDTFDNLEDIPVTTPKFEVLKPSPLSPKKTPTYLDQDNLPVFNQMKNGINTYLFNREKWRKENSRNQKSTSSKTPVNDCKHDESRRGKFPEKLPQVLFKVTRSAEKTEEFEENDYYFSDSESDDELVYANIGSMPVLADTK